MELTQPGLGGDTRDRVQDLVTCHPDPYTAATNGKHISILNHENRENLLNILF